jgi:hypothetical protein
VCAAGEARVSAWHSFKVLTHAVGAYALPLQGASQILATPEQISASPAINQCWL